MSDNDQVLRNIKRSVNKMHTDMFHTCKSRDESTEFIKRYNDAHITTAFMVGMNTALWAVQEILKDADLSDEEEG